MRVKRRRKKAKLDDSARRWASIKRKYGLSKEDYNKILLDQKGVCYICQKPPEKCRPRQNLAVDHNHATGEIRGLLCFNCNHNILGRTIRDDIKKVKRILNYLTRKVTYGKVPSI